jgi:hypothetical protein
MSDKAHRPKILILGHGEHGKDTVADIITELTGLKFESSSHAAAELAVWPSMPQYTSVERCFDDRRNHREEWKRLITEYNTPDKSRLCREIIARCDGYVGMRCPLEYKSVKHLFDFVVWVDASKRKPIDPTMGIEREPDMVVIDNNESRFLTCINVEKWRRAAGLCS